MSLVKAADRSKGNLSSDPSANELRQPTTSQVWAYTCATANNLNPESHYLFRYALMKPRDPNSPHDQALATTEDATVQAASDNGTGDSMTQASGNEALQLADERRGSISAADTGEEDGNGNGNGASQKEDKGPPLPPRPFLFPVLERPGTAKGKRSALQQAKPTIALSSIDIQTLSFPDGTRGTFSTPASRSVSNSVSGTQGGQSTPGRNASHNGSEADDSASVMSYAPTLKANGDLASLLDDGLNTQSPAWKLLNSQADAANIFERVEYEDASLTNFEHEFDEIEEVDSKEGGNEGGISLIVQSTRSKT